MEYPLADLIVKSSFRLEQFLIHWPVIKMILEFYYVVIISLSLLSALSLFDHLFLLILGLRPLRLLTHQRGWSRWSGRRAKTRPAGTTLVSRAGTFLRPKRSSGVRAGGVRFESNALWRQDQACLELQSTGGNDVSVPSRHIPAPNAPHSVRCGSFVAHAVLHTTRR